MEKVQVITTEHILLTLCRSVTAVLSAAAASTIEYSPMVQKIHKTGLKPDIGCFVLFDGGFSGLVVINFTAQAAMEIYNKYMQNMGFPSEELAKFHTSDEVSNVMGELMNQIVGDFTSKVRTELQTSITQSQPKMMAITKQVQISVDTNLDRPQARRVTFTTEQQNIFYLELAMDKTEFIKLHEFEQQQHNPDAIIAEEQNRTAAAAVAESAAGDVDDDFLANLGL